MQKKFNIICKFPLVFTHSSDVCLISEGYSASMGTIIFAWSKVYFYLQEIFRWHLARVYWTICRFNFLLFVAHVRKWFSVNYTWSWVCDSRLAGTHLASVLERDLETVSNCNSHIFLDLIVIYIFDQWVWAWSSGERYPGFLIEWIFYWIESSQIKNFE